MDTERINQLEQRITELENIINKGDFSSVNVSNKVNQVNKYFILKQQTATPIGTPILDGEARMYIKTKRIIFQFNNGGTIRYKSLRLDGTGTLWDHATVAP